MTQPWMTELRAWFLRPSVVHRLPGRLRLRIPALTRLTDEQAEFAALWRDLLLTPAAIEAVDVNLRTGSALIRYDAARITERDLLAFLHSLNRFVVRHWERLASTPTAQLSRVLARLQRVAKTAISRRPLLDEAVEVPDDVWA